MSKNDKISALRELEKDDIHEAKREMVMRFVRDQESLQTSQVDLKLVGDETIDLIDSALVAKDEENGANGRFDESQNELLTRDISAITLGGNDSGKTGTEHRVLPRPPSRACRPKSRNRKLSATKSEERTRKSSQEQLASFCQLSPQENIAEPPKSPSWRPNRTTSFNKYAIYSTSDPLHSYSTVDSYADIKDSVFEQTRPKSTRTLRRIRSGEVITARIASANPPERIACGISTLIGTTSRPKSNSYCEERKITKNHRTFVNLGSIDKQVSFEGPLELEPVNPSEFPIFRSNSAASTAATYPLVQLPPISTETSPSATFPPS